MVWQAAWWTLLAVITSTAAVQYDCSDAGVPASPRCNRSCITAIGNSLLSLYGDISGTHSPQPWRGVKAPELCGRCSGSSGPLLPSYCCWQGVYCCSEDDGSIMDAASDPYGCKKDLPMGVHQLLMRGWNLSGSLSDSVIDHLAQLSLHGLHSVDLSANALVGSIANSIGRLQNLRSINLNLNDLEGTLPMEMGSLERLQHFFASFNNLTGPLEGRFCVKDNTRLKSLILRANQFTGTINMSHCLGLELLDVQDNRFHGTLPIGVTNQNLISLRVTNNNFNSNIPDAIWRLPQLTTIEASNNGITGTLSPYMGSVNNLVNIRLGNNSLRGTLPGNLTSNSQMLLLELNDNTGIHGTFPDVSKMVGIRQLNVRNTSISGSIPEAFGSLPYLEFVDIRLTRMLCCDSQSQVDDLAAKDVNLLLPSFLMFNEVVVQFDTTRNVQRSELDPDQPTDVLCGSVQRRPQPESAWNVQNLPVTNDAVPTQHWSIGPLYSWYKNCTCTPAYVKAAGAPVPVDITRLWCKDTVVPWDARCADVHIFRCALPSPPALTLKQQVAVGIIVAVCCVALLIAANICMAHANKMRRYYMRAKTRLQGSPKHGRLSLVVTDIEGYSEMFKRAPEVMYRALMIHNRVMNAAKYANCGFVLEQEGDSYTLAFYDAFDAVAFCLQAQQALLAVQWPEGLDGDEAPIKAANSMTTRKPSRLQRLSQLLASGRRRRRPSTMSTASSTVSEDGAPSIHCSPSQQLSHALSTRLAGLGAGLKSLPANDAVLFSGLRVRMGVITGDVPSGTPIKSSALFQLAKVMSDFGNGGQTIIDHATFAAVKESLTVLGAVGPNGINYQRLATHRSLWTSCKVMLGCTSPLEPAEAAVVLDMGAYFQPSAAAADTEQVDLACYPSPGLQEQGSEEQQPGCCSSWRAFFAQLRSKASASSMASTPVFLAGPSGEAASLCQQPGPGLRQQLQRGLSALRRSTSSPTTESGSSSQQQQQQREQSPSAASCGSVTGVIAEGAAEGQSSAAASARRLLSLRHSMSRSRWDEGRRRDWNNVRLFQILPPPLTGRAHVWHNQLNTKEGWRCWDMPYFNAPGSQSVPLSCGGKVGMHLGSTTNGRPGCCMCVDAAAFTAAGSGVSTPKALGSSASNTGPSHAAVLLSATGSPGLLGSTSLSPPPAVTMVFLAAENPEALVRRRRTFTPKIQALLNHVVRDSLRRCGGYLCRVQEGEMRFMLAFANPAVALEFCMVVQEAAMYLPWPAEPVLLYEGCTVERDVCNKIVFRGPRLKMGVCEGIPSSIFPDHEGRADYHGSVVNMAARFTDKGAKGGQIACTLDLALKVMAIWAGGSADSSASSLTGEVVAAGGAGCCPPAAVGRSYAAAAAALSAADGVAPLLPPEQTSSPPRFQGQELGLGDAETGQAVRPLPVQHNDLSSNPRSSTAGSNSWPWRQRSWNKRVSSQGPAAPASSLAAAAAVAGASPVTPPFGSVASSPFAACTAAVDDNAAAAAAGTAGGDWNVPASGRRTGTGAATCSDMGGGVAGTAAGCHQASLVGDGILSSSAVAVRLELHQQQRASAGMQLNSIESGQVLLQLDASHSQLQQAQQQQQLLLLQKGVSGHGGPLPGRLSSNGGVSQAAARQGPAPWQQQQQQARLPPVRTPNLHTSAVGAGASGFTLSDVTRALVQVEVHRLGLFAFKGGPSQQEMVQVLPTHLLGRLQVTEHSVLPASRKGHMLQKLEGRVGEPVTVQLPMLAVEYKARLPERLLVSPSRFPAGRGRAAAPAAGRAAPGEVMDVGRSITLPASSSESIILPASNSAPAEDSCTVEDQLQQQHHQGHNVTRAVLRPGDLTALRVMSDVTLQASSGSPVKQQNMPLFAAAGSSVRSVSPSVAAAGSRSLVTGLSAHRQVSSMSSSCDVAEAAKDGSKASGINVQDHISIRLPASDTPSAVDSGMQRQGLSGELVARAGSSADTSLKPEAVTLAVAQLAELDEAAAAAAAAGLTDIANPCGHSNLLRHDSFRSVGSADVDEEAGLAGAGAACRSSKSGSSDVASCRFSQGGVLSADGGERVAAAAWMASSEHSQ